MTVVEFPVSGLSESDFEALRGAGLRRLKQGLAGHVTRGYNKRGRMWAAILERPEGPPLHHFSRDKGVYYVLHFTEDGQARLVDASRSFAEVLDHLPARPPRRMP
jgi:hypothetical protein